MMKKLMNFTLMTAIAFLGAVGFTACTSTDDTLAETNPNYNPETGEVTTEFVFNVATNTTPNSTRMSAGDTQANITSAAGFRGITNSELLTFKLGTSNDGKHIASAQTYDKNYAFGTVLGAGRLDPVNGDGNTDIPKSRRVMQLSLPTETNAMIAYGKAIKTKSDNEQGFIKWNMGDGETKDLSKISFSLQKIVPETPYTEGSLQYQTAFLQYENLIAAVLTEIVNSGVPPTTEFVFDTESLTLTDSLKWSDYIIVTTAGDNKTLERKTTSAIDPTKPTSALGEILANGFISLNTIYTDELRSGNGEAIAGMMKDLMVLINSVADATPTSLAEVAAKAVGQAVKTTVEKYFDPENNEYVFRDVTTIKNTMIAVLNADKNLISESSDFNVFPKDFNLPLGSVLLQFIIATNNTGDDTFQYAYKGTIETYAMGGSSDANDGFNPLNYMYPAELCYFGNSPIRVTDETVATKDYPDGTGAWNTDANWVTDKWKKNGHVTASTRSVAMQYNINYGTALLETKVRYGAQLLQDNNAAIQAERYGATGESNNTINVTTSDSHFVLTGVLVGGQEPEAGWNFLAKSATPGFGAMVYDNVGSVNIPAATAAAGGNPSDAVYTLLWDNWQESLKDDKQRIVYVALEFKNNSKGFYGKNNFIREGATFYIVGKLDPNAGLDADDLSAGITWPENQALPPYNDDGSTVKQRRVFMQDFKTTATFVIGEKSLQEALVSVPDLRSGQISLGLSVDLKWQTGLSFNEVILGDD